MSGLIEKLAEFAKGSRAFSFSCEQMEPEVFVAHVTTVYREGTRTYYVTGRAIEASYDLALGKALEEHGQRKRDCWFARPVAGGLEARKDGEGVAS
jgi:hypothetical protein